ncbi:putative uncharacterized protein [Clostridium sp. CAG:568]|nr:putative uncharacterized protein [Clostridium sp. CAG:568]
MSDIESEKKTPLTYQDFWTDIISSCQNDLESSTEYPQVIFFEKFEDILEDNNVFSGLDFHYFESKNSSRKYRQMHIDYGMVDYTDNSINLLTVDYDPSHISTITNDKRDDMYGKMVSFIANVKKGYFQENSLESDPIYSFVTEIIRKLPTTDNLNLFILSSNVKSNTLKELPPQMVDIDGKEVNVVLKIIDIQYLFNSSLSTRKTDPVNIIVSDINNGKVTGIKCLPANIQGDGYEAYLAVLPGDFLSEVYRLYGGRLLEKNVRSFLSVRGNVNKGIRNTIRTEPDKFFTYNNGIACTASSIKTENKTDGLYITELNDLQIINGGQTTASLRNAVLTDKDHIVDLTKVFVPMKLTVLDESIPDDERDIMVGNISKYSNSQNKVSNSDLNSNSPFYVQLEKLSRKIYTPTMTDGHQTRWYFERSRGQYERDQMELTDAKRKQFKAYNPRNQMMKIVDIAKFYNSVNERPFEVSWGGQMNAEDFQLTMQKMYEKNPVFVNDHFFKLIVSYGILFQKSREIIRNTDTYAQHSGILAQVVPYTISMLMHLVRDMKLDLDWKDIWNKQDLPQLLKDEIQSLGEWVINVLVDPSREKDNVGEWAKLDKCWKNMLSRKYVLKPELSSILVSPQEEKADALSAKKEAKLTRSVDLGLYVFKLGAKYWQDILNAGYRYNKFTNDYNGCKDVQFAIKACDRNKLIESKSALEDLMRIKKEFEEEGIIQKREPVEEEGEE